MKVRSEVIQPDASAWSAVVEVRGVVFVASFVANRLVCRLAPYRHPPRYPKWCLEYVQRWAQARIASLPANWMQAHQALYGSPSAGAAWVDEPRST
ncbi:hypothetical protein [Bordetella pseudohinzii]|uniref:Uncharacterized protein n=1 Tax=Bordetella pseudohinzii TaxID=1331258 RepID=A0A0M7HTV8_9BORD|nr:hypothetical protein [Bordetella pseudohinzii]CUJ13188.1 Uncharacterised protein [Bordetella pseudohinzii]